MGSKLTSQISPRLTGETTRTRQCLLPARRPARSAQTLVRSALPSGRPVRRGACGVLREVIVGKHDGRQESASMVFAYRFFLGAHEFLQMMLSLRYFRIARQGAIAEPGGAGQLRSRIIPTIQKRRCKGESRIWHPRPCLPDHPIRAEQQRLRNRHAKRLRRFKLSPGRTPRRSTGRSLGFMPWNPVDVGGEAAESSPVRWQRRTSVHRHRPNSIPPITAGRF